MKKASLLLLTIVASVSFVAFVSGCEKGPPKDNSNIEQPPKPAPPGTQQPR